MKIGLTGSTGYIGKLISNKLELEGYQIKKIKRELLYGDSKSLKNEIANCDIIIHLSGATILTRWTTKKIREIYDSRVLTTKNLVNAIIELDQKKQLKKLISASAIGLYQAGKTHDENSTDFDIGFVGKVVKDWENSLNDLPESVLKIVFRMAPVLGKQSATVENMLLPFKLGVGGTIGNGKQAFPFVHETDVVNAFLWAVREYNCSRTFNLVAPQNISNKTFTKSFANILHRPVFLRVPYFLLKLLYGKAAKILVTSPVVEPKALLDSNFKFLYPTIDVCLKEILN